ncbi:hypothetical protein U5817_16090 [Aromatoleum evansii]|uniref:Uncharacterized protein n=1 Tax=Aromatoleum evansii TaxID=59406 RepID=A0ABZ1AJY3_AROEV|nr:hypothetical protein U5817_16090 [Aromatoleum evansii]
MSITTMKVTATDTMGMKDMPRATNTRMPTPHPQHRRNRPP